MNDKKTNSDKARPRNEINAQSPKSPLRQKARGSSADVVTKVNSTARDLEAELVRFRTGDRSIDFNVDITAETVWASEQQIADLFRVDRLVVRKHLTDIFAEGELEQGTVIAEHERTSRDGKIDGVLEYSLDAIVSVGYRVNSVEATKFRKWATETLRSYIVRGYALNERRLKGDPEATDQLSARLREIRAEEKHVFAKVRDYFKEASSDYDGSAQGCRTFFALLQDKFHFAASGMTACQLVLSRADHRNPNMGLTTFAGEAPTIQDAKVGKNYLSEKELHILHIVSEQFLLHVQSKAIRNIIMTMEDLARKFDELLRVNGYEVFVGYGRDFQKPKADKHAMAEFARFMVRQRKKIAQVGKTLHGPGAQVAGEAVF